MTYNLTNLTNAETVSELVVYANSSVDGLLFAVLMLSIFFVLLFAFMRYEFVNALMASSFICFVLSLIIASVGWLNFLYPAGFGILAGLALFMDVVVNS